MRRRALTARILLACAVAAGTGGLVAGIADVGNAAGAAYYVAPTGSDSAAGTQAAPWATFAHAQSVAQPGDTVYFRGGTYTYTHADSSCSSETASVDGITLNKSGSSGNLINYVAYPGEHPVFDFSKDADDCRIKGFDVTGSYIHLKGLEVEGVPQNNDLNHESWGIWITGSDNVFEQLNLHNNMGPGLFIQNGGGNLVLNSDSHDNYDPNSSDGAGQNADGFGAHISAGYPGNVFRGDRAWWNSDDGFDLINAYSSVTIEDSWAWRNGYLPETTTVAPSGNGNGFKAGGYGGVYVGNGVVHTVEDSVAFDNSAAGFYANHHTVADNFYNNTGYDNHPDFNMLGISSSGAAIGIGNLRNNIAYAGSLTSNMTGTNAADNSWNLSVTMSDSQFQSVSTTGWDAARQSDGSLPALPYLHLAANSTLIDKGVNVGLPYNGSAPDLGAFETGSVTASASPSPSASRSASPSPSPSPSKSASAPPSPSASATTPVPSGACAAAYVTQTSWSGGFQGLVTVTAGSSAITGWTVKWTLVSGQTITELWNGTLTTSGSNVTVTNASYNGALTAGSSTTFGFTANGSASSPTVSCSAS
nr:cellulose binding domain-containing protein [Actinospica robiniae]